MGGNAEERPGSLEAEPGLLDQRRSLDGAVEVMARQWAESPAPADLVRTGALLVSQLRIVVAPAEEEEYAKSRARSSDGAYRARLWHAHPK